MRALFIHAHYDDFEFTAAGLFTLWKEALGANFRGRILICTDGAAGHYQLSRQETARVRFREQTEAAQVAGVEFELLRLPDGTAPREGCLELNRFFLAAIWKRIRDFEPDYLFAPPIPSNTLVGVHPDHAAVAEAVRKVAYLVNVPHAYSPEYPDEPESARATPVILTVHDGYMAGNEGADLALNIEAAFETMAEASYCHRSQIAEWLPWVGRHAMTPPRDREEWRKILRGRMARRNLSMSFPPDPLLEFYKVTAWGQVPSMKQVLQDFPGLIQTPALENLHLRLADWGTS